MKGTQRKISFTGGKKGIYQVQLAGCDDHFVKVSITPETRFGVLGHPDFIAGHGDQFRESYLYVPELPFFLTSRKNLEIFLIEHAFPRTRSVQLSRDGKLLEIENLATNEKSTFLTPGQALGQGKVSLEGIPAGSVLKMVIPGKGDFLVRISGIPAILCPDEETARQIAGGLIQIPAGPTVSFPFQKELWESIKYLKGEDFIVKDFVPGEWYKPSAADLRGITAIQWAGNLSPGTMDTLIPKTNALLQKLQPFDVHEFFLQMPGIDFSNVALYYLYPFKGNKLYHHPALKNLFTLAIIKRWMYYRGGEVIYEAHELNVAYAQGFHWDFWEPVWNMKESLDPAVLKAFQKGVRRIAQRMFYANALELVISNGRTTIPLNLYHAYLITGDPKLEALSLRYFRRMMTALDGPHSGWSKTGYFREHFGPDGGYCTYPLYQLGRLYQLSKHPEVLECLDHLTRWICYTTFPTEGRLTGPTSWNSRIAVAAIEHIWGSGYRYFASQSEWAARIYRRIESAKTSYDLPDPSFDQGVAQPEKPTLLNTHLARGVLPDKPLPAESEESFFTDVGGGNELFAVRRGKYYALLFAGNRPAFWMDVSLDGNACYNGGGITGLYLHGGPKTILLGRVSKQYGFPIEMWEEQTVPVATGQIADGRYFNTGVSRNQVFPDPSTWSIKTTGEAISAPVNYERSYRFEEESISARILLKNADLHHDVFQYRKHFRNPHHQITHAWELVPVYMEKTTTIIGLDSQGNGLGEIGSDGKEGVAQIEVNNGRGGIRLKLDTPRFVKLSKPPSAGGNLSRSVQIRIAQEVKVDAEAVLEYVIEPVTK